jgi:hypothetical protein
MPAIHGAPAKCRLFFNTAGLVGLSVNQGRRLRDGARPTAKKGAQRERVYPTQNPIRRTQREPMLSASARLTAGFRGLRMTQHANRSKYSRRPKSLEGFSFGDGKTFADVVDAG